MNRSPCRRVLVTLLIWAGFLGIGTVVSRAQDSASAGAVAGTVMDEWHGVPLAGVVVSVRGTTLAVATGSDGRYLLEGVPVGDQTVAFSKSGYARAVVTEVRVGPGQASTVNLRLRPEFYEMEEYEVTAAVLEGQSAELLELRQRAAAMQDAIGSVQFSRAGASDAADIVSKVPGITVAESKTPVVRGLNERYTGLQLNGAEVPSANPYYKTAPLDLFPAGLIDRVVVNKTFTPDQPGNFTGGGINIMTRSFPERFTLSSSVGVGYNTQASLNRDFASYEGGSSDWLGMDDGTRALPSALDTAELDAALVQRAPTTARPNQPELIARADRLDELTRELGVTQFQPTTSRAPLDHNLSLNIGDTIQLLERPFGMFAGLTYSRKFQYYDDGKSDRYLLNIDQNPPLAPKFQYDEVRGVEEVLWGSVVNLAWQVSPDHELGFNFLYNQNSEDTALRRYGPDLRPGEQGHNFDLNTLHFIERNLQSYQLRGRHDFPEARGIRLDWLGSMARTTQDEPDLRYFNFLVETNGGAYALGANNIPQPSNPTRYFRELEEQNWNFKTDVTVPFDSWNVGEAEFKLGYYFSGTTRSYFDRNYYYHTSGFVFDGNPNTFLTEENLGYHPTTNAAGLITYNWGRYLRAERTSQGFYDGQQDLQAGYGMVELPLLERLRFIGGARLEHTDLTIGARAREVPVESEIDQLDVLPAASLILEVITNMNVRFSYSQTVARPTFREMSPIRSYDTVLNEFLDGNPNLQMTSIQNFDLRWEWFTTPSALLAVSLFHKDLENPIEKTFVDLQRDIVSYENRESARIYGVEFEVRQRLDFVSPLWAPFSVGGNFAWIESEVPLTPEELTARRRIDPGADDTRQLYDQSPYVVNADLTYEHPRWGTVATVLFGIYGPRIFIADPQGLDVYEQPVPVLDFVLSQRLGKHWRLRFSAKNLLDPPYERTYSEERTEYLHTRITKGRTFGLTVAYDW
ncbi:MAG: TonB-dependent receptor [Verrucomicrobia bacterium]|nr:TonB-dependent receptor [Verrucomicrobiota bacterium]